MDVHLILNVAALMISVAAWIYAVRSRAKMQRLGVDASEHAARAIAAEKSVTATMENLQRPTRHSKLP